MERQEEKYIVNLDELSKVLSRYGAYECFPKRTLNSLYFDTKDWDCFFAGEEGVTPRHKYRFRWYGPSSCFVTTGKLETKSTFSFFKTKTSVTLDNPSVEDISRRILEATHQTTQPACYICYQRLYFQNQKGLRLTYDFDIKAKTFQSLAWTPLRQNILEIKYASLRQDSRYALDFGERKTRYSKYNEAVSNLFNL